MLYKWRMGGLCNLNCAWSPSNGASPSSIERFEEILSVELNPAMRITTYSIFAYSEGKGEVDYSAVQWSTV